MQLLLPAATLSAMLAGFDALGLDTNAILRGAGLTRTQIDDPYAGFPEGLFEVIWRQAFLQDPRPDLPTRAGLAVPFGAFGLLDHLGASSQTVGEAFHTLRLFFWLVSTGIDLKFTHAAGDWMWVINEQPGTGAIISDQWTLALFVQRFREKKSAKFEEVHLTQPSTLPASVYAKLLGLPVQLDQPRSGLKLAPDVWNAPLATADPMLRRTLLTLAERVDIQAFEEAPLGYVVRTRLAEMLPAGQSSAEAIAEELGLSLRTFQRRLTQEKMSFTELLDAYRQEEAMRQIERGRRSMTEIAYDLGYNEQSSFNRAFKRWTGTTPSRWMSQFGAS